MCIGLKMGILVLDFNSLDKFQAFKHRFILFVILIFSKDQTTTCTKFLILRVYSFRKPVLSSCECW